MRPQRWFRINAALFFFAPPVCPRYSEFGFAVSILFALFSTWSSIPLKPFAFPSFFVCARFAGRSLAFRPPLRNDPL